MSMVINRVRRDKRGIKTGSFVHICNRGNHRDLIVYDDTDKYFMQETIFKLFTAYKQELITYCIMDNHYHLQVRVSDPLSFSKLKQSFAIRCAKRFNKKYSNVGHLFQDRYKSVLLEDDFALLYVNRYIHNNPKDLSGIESFTDIMGYQFSGLPDFLGKRNGFINPTGLGYIMKYFSSTQDYIDFLSSDDIIQHLNFILSKSLKEEMNLRLEASLNSLVPV